MNTCLENVANYVKPFLLSNIVIRTDKKILKKGKFKIFQIKQHYIRFMIEVDGSLKMYEMPYPFTVKRVNNITVFNYKLSAFLKDSELILQSKFLDISQTSKLYNNLVYILTSAE
jgi:hypothetical protein|tara:strand:+ start:1323 stop:1667 length:345 start_codon:yes stop_codon:yes gene_type:complete